MNESPAMRTGPSVTDECRRLAELLDLDAVGVSVPVGASHRMACWTAEHVPSVPDLQDILDGRAEGWIASPLVDGASVFALFTPDSSSRSEAILQAVGPALIEGLGAEPVAPPITTAEPPPPVSQAEPAVQRVLAALRIVLESPDATIPGLLFAVREALAVPEVFHFVERGGDVEISSSPASERSRRLPKEIRASLRALSRSDPLEEGTARQLGVVLGASTPFVSAAFCRDDDPVEIILIGSSDGHAVSGAGIRLVGQVVAAGRAALESRRQAVESQFLKERTRWAYEIHDGLTQAVTTAVLELEALAHKIQRDPEEAIETLTMAKAEIRKALSELRGLLFELQREQPREERTDEPLTKYVQDVVRRWRLPARITVKGDLHHVPKALLGAAYVVIREALANAAKHASARSVTVWVGATMDEMVVEVGDSGRGFSAPQDSTGSEPRHFGLEMMKKRVAEVGGTIDVQSQPGRGTRIVARLPIRSRGDER